MPERERHDQHVNQHERKDRVAEALTRLDDAIGAIHTSEAFRRYLDLQARFHRYSSGNVLLILAQRPDATQVAGYRAWQRLGRQVRRGERGITILVPMPTRFPLQQSEMPGSSSADSSSAHEPDSTDARSTERPEPGRRGRLRFGAGAVFDVSQTDGAALPTFEAPLLTGDAGADLYGYLEQVAREEAVRVERGGPGLVRPETMGYYAPDERLIVVREAAQLQMTKTLAHELAHHLDYIHAAADRRPRSTPEEETVAESVAYIVCARFGHDTGTRSFPYVAAWSREREVFKQALGRIQLLSHDLIDRVERRRIDPAPAELVSECPDGHLPT